MKYSLSEYIENFDKTVNQFNDAQGEILLKAAENAQAMVKKRVIETGIDHEGNKFSSPNSSGGYSRKPMLASRSNMSKDAYNTIAGSKEKRRQLTWVTIGGSGGFSSYLAVASGESEGTTSGGRGARLFEIKGGYEEYRKLHGKQVKHVDFSFSNLLWSNINIRSKTNSRVVIGALSTDNRKKMEGLVSRFGTILALNDNEFKMLKEEVRDQYQEIINSNL